jgi:pyrimidine operon attenuation protein/uracil phosphoribosyltransferase
MNFNEFSKGFANDAPMYKSDDDRAVLCRIKVGVWALMLDSVLGGRLKNDPAPGPLTAKSGDAIMDIVRIVPVNDLLLIGSHYSVDPNIASASDFADGKGGNFLGAHSWTDAYQLRERIDRHRKTPYKTCWFSGDIHREHFRYHRNIYYVTTGRLGTKTGASDSKCLRQAAVVRIDENEIVVHRFRYDTEGHNSQAEYGDWKSDVANREPNTVPTSVVDLRAPVVDPSETAGAQVSSNTQVATEALTRNDSFTSVATSKCEILSAESSQDIRTNIVKNKLYTWGRFETSPNEVLLSWVSIGPLLSAPKRLGATTRDMATWLDSQMGQRKMTAEQAVFLGIDCWGSILASQLSVVTGIRNFCIAARGRGDYHTNQEAITDEILQVVALAKYVIIVTDVVATGRTLRWLYDQFPKAENDEKVWLLLSVLCDPKQPLFADCSFIQAHGTACQITRPILPADRVPGLDLVPNNLAIPQSS